MSDPRPSQITPDGYIVAGHERRQRRGRRRLVAGGEAEVYETAEDAREALKTYRATDQDVDWRVYALVRVSEDD